MENGTKAHEEFAKLDTESILTILEGYGFTEPVICQEMTIDFNEYFFGTPDLIVYEDGHLLILDYKAGYQKVEVVDNPQLHCYAYLAMNLAMFSPIDKCTIAIYQNEEIHSSPINMGLIDIIQDRVLSLSTDLDLGELDAPCSDISLCKDCMYFGRFCDGCLATLPDLSKDMDLALQSEVNIIKYKPAIVKWLNNKEDTIRENLKKDPAFYKGEITLKQGARRCEWKENLPEDIAQKYSVISVQKPKLVDLERYGDYIEVSYNEPRPVVKSCE
jgi:hypothetical protein